MTMRSLLVLVSFIIAGPNLFAVAPASSDEKELIQSHLDRTGEIEREIIKKTKDLEVERQINGEGIAVREMERSIELLNHKLIVEKGIAIHLTLVAYDILPSAAGKPILPKGRVVIDNAYKGAEVSWCPTADDGEARKYLYVDERDAEKSRKDKSGETFGAGITVLYDAAFITPEDLAITLYHEQQHFIWYTTPGLGDKLPDAESEVFAYTKERKHYADFGLGKRQIEILDPWSRKQILDFKKKAQRKNKAADRQRFRVPTDAELGEIQKDSGDLAQIAANEILEVRRKTEELVRQREAEAHQREEERIARAWVGSIPDRAIQEIRNCGMEPIIDEQRYLRGFSYGSRTVHFDDSERVDLDGLKVALSMIAGCENAVPPKRGFLGLFRREGAVPEPCNNAVDIINRRWNESWFAVPIDLAFGLSHDVCLDAVYNNIRGNLPLTQDDFNDLVIAGVKNKISWEKQARWAARQQQESSTSTNSGTSGNSSGHRQGNNNYNNRRYMGPCGNAGSSCLHR